MMLMRQGARRLVGRGRSVRFFNSNNKKNEVPLKGKEVPPTGAKGPQVVNANANANAGGGGGAGKLLLLGAIAAPIVYVGVQTRNDEEFRKTFKEKFPAGYDIVAPLVIPAEDGADGSSGKSESRSGGMIEGMSLAKVNQELHELAHRWEQAGHHLETFTKKEVEMMKETLSSALKKKDDGSTVKEPAGTKNEEAAETATAAAEEEEEEEEEEEPTRSKIDAVRAKARKVKARADASSEKKIKQLEKDLRGDLEIVLSEDLSSLDEKGLRKRVVELVLELRDRSRWEALRLHELLSKHTDDLVKKYDSLMREQSERYEELVRLESNKAAHEASRQTQRKAEEHMQAAEQHWRRKLDEALDRQRHEMGQEMEKRFQHAKSSIEASAAEELSSRVQALNALKEKVKSLQAAVSKRSENEALSQQLCQLSVATMELAHAIEANPRSVPEEIDRVRRAGRSDPIVRKTLDSVSTRVLTSGVASHIELVRRFDAVYDACSRVAIVPEDGGVFEHAAAKIVAKLTIPGGKKEESHPQEATLERARHLLLDNNDLEGCLKEMESLKGVVRDTAADWISLAKDRVEIQQAVLLMKTHISAQAASIQ